MRQDDFDLFNIKPLSCFNSSNIIYTWSRFKRSCILTLIPQEKVDPLTFMSIM